MRFSQSELPTQHGNFSIYCFPSNHDPCKEHLVLYKESGLANCPLVRIHSECLTGDVFASSRCDCGQQLAISMNMIAQEGGLVVYLRQEGRGIGLFDKIKAYALQDEGLDTVDANLSIGREADERDYSEAVSILNHFEFTQIRLITNNPEKIRFLENHGIKVQERVPCVIDKNSHNSLYLDAKKMRMQHLL
jgi:3,4-dihydroxy 2-butanone 4-phosphate synthase / GTP cyclohydrolase II